MLEANPDLTWRDVKSILRLTAQVVVNDPEDTTRVTNAANISHSNRYGFGIVNAEKAVNTSMNWVNVPEEIMLVREGSGLYPIKHRADADGDETRANVTFAYPTPFEIETVELFLKLNHTSRGHLRITMTSPGGTISVLTPGNRPEDQRDEWMKFTSVRHWGESANGNWTVSIYDTTDGDVSNCSDHVWTWIVSEDSASTLGMFDDDDRHVHCEHNRLKTLRHFCADGAINPNGTYAKLCDDGDEDACGVVNEFLNHVDNDQNATEACCLCGGGDDPDNFPDYVFAWKIALYGHNVYKDFFSGARDDAGFGTGGLRAGINEDKFKMPSMEPLVFLDLVTKDIRDNETDNSTSDASCFSLCKSLFRCVVYLILK